MTPNRTQEFDQVDMMSTIRTVADNEALKGHRDELARFAAGTFADAGEKLNKFTTIHRDTKTGNVANETMDEAITVSILLQISSQLVSASADLFSDGRNYAAAALLRQMVEVEYLAWAVDVRDQDGKRWLHSDKKQRMTFFLSSQTEKGSQGEISKPRLQFSLRVRGTSDTGWCGNVAKQKPGRSSDTAKRSAGSHRSDLGPCGSMGKA